MSKPSSLPRYVSVIHGSYWHRPPGGPNKKIGRVNDGLEQVQEFLGVCAPVPPAPQGTTLADWFSLYQKSRKFLDLAPSSKEYYLIHLKYLTARFGMLAPSKLYKKHVREMLAEQTRGAGQMNQVYAVLSAVYTTGINESWKGFDDNVNAHPCKGVTVNTLKPRTRNVRDGEFAAVKALANPMVQCAMELARLLGQRRADLLKLRWADVSEDGIYFKHSKTGKEIIINMNATVDAVLTMARKLEPLGPTVLRTQTGTPFTSAGFDSVWHRLMGKALKVQAIAQRFTFHDLRAKNVTDSADLASANVRLGHATMAMTKKVYDRGIRRVDALR